MPARKEAARTHAVKELENAHPSVGRLPPCVYNAVLEVLLKQPCALPKRCGTNHHLIDKFIPHTPVRRARAVGFGAAWQDKQNPGQTCKRYITRHVSTTIAPCQVVREFPAIRRTVPQEAASWRVWRPLMKWSAQKGGRKLRDELLTKTSSNHIGGNVVVLMCGANS